MKQTEKNNKLKKKEIKKNRSEDNSKSQKTGTIPKIFSPIFGDLKMVPNPDRELILNLFWQNMTFFKTVALENLQL